jgi:hypothetical protein
MADAATQQATASQISSLVTKLDGKTVEFQNTVNDTLSDISWLIPDSWIQWIKDRWNDFCDWMAKVWKQLTEIVENMGAPWDLSSTANAWSDKIGGPVSGKAQVATAGELSVDDNWDGDAATQYKQKMPLQATALDKVRSTLSEGVNNAMSTAQLGIWVFWVALVAALVTLIAGIIGAMASSATVLGLPPGVAIAIAAVIVFLAAIAGGIVTLRATLSNANSTIRRALSDNSGFENGHWPPFHTS